MTSADVSSALVFYLEREKRNGCCTLDGEYWVKKFQAGCWFDFEKLL
jgi:hypothetical protein